MKELIVGIDPGQKGALAVIGDGALQVYDLKPCYKKTGASNSLDPFLFNNLIFKTLPPSVGEVMVFCEESQVIGGGGIKAGIKSLRSIFDARGVMRSVFWTWGYKINYIQPQVWKRALELLGHTKFDSVEKACQIFPESKNLFKKQYHGRFIPLDGRAEAALIAHYGWCAMHVLLAVSNRSKRTVK